MTNDGHNLEATFDNLTKKAAMGNIQMLLAMGEGVFRETGNVIVLGVAERGTI